MPSSCLMCGNAHQHALTTQIGNENWHRIFLGSTLVPIIFLPASVVKPFQPGVGVAGRATLSMYLCWQVVLSYSRDQHCKAHVKNSSLRFLLVVVMFEQVLSLVVATSLTRTYLHIA